MTPEDLKPANAADVATVTGRVAEKGDTAIMRGDNNDSEQSQKKNKKSGGLGASGWLVLVVLLVVGSIGVYIAYDYLNKPAPTDREEDISVLPTSRLGDFSEPFDARRAINRTSPAHETVDVSGYGGGIPGIDPRPTLVESMQRHKADQLDIRETNFEILSHRVSSPNVGATASGGTNDLDLAPDNKEVDAPQDVKEHVMARGPNTYPPSGWPRDKYMVLLRNQLNRADSSRIDLEKAYILLSMYFNPDLDPDLYGSYFSELALELRNELAPIDEDTGERMPIMDGRKRVDIINRFMLYGTETYRGWDVQEYYPSTTTNADQLREQHMLVDQVLRFNPRQRNKASNTALNIITLILLQKVQLDEFEKVQRVNVRVPLYGVRLPDRTILRYTSMGQGQVMPGEDNVAEGASISGWNLTSGNTKEERTQNDMLDYGRNIEFLRNAKHYDRDDYTQRYRIPQQDIDMGVYLWTLSNKRFFATLGYELALREFELGVAAGELYGAGQPSDMPRVRTSLKLLDEWVLDRDDGTVGPRSAPRQSISEITGRPRSKPPVSFPRGDTGLREAYVLYAQILLRMGGFAEIQSLLNNNPVIRDSVERSSEVNARLAMDRNKIDEATAYLEDALEQGDNNPRVQFLLGEIQFIDDDRTIPLSTDANAARPSGAGGEKTPLEKAIVRFNTAERQDVELRRLSAAERRVLHYHRGIAYYRIGENAKALKDIEYHGKITPDFMKLPVHKNLVRAIKVDMQFETLAKGFDDVEEGDWMRSVEFLRQDMLNNVVHATNPADPTSPRFHKDRRDVYLRAARALDTIEAVVVKIQLANALREVTGQDFGLNARQWERWFTQHFEEQQ